MIKCSCGDENCKMKIWLETVNDKVAMWFTDKDGDDNVMYLDANSVIYLVKALKSCLLELLEEG